MIDRSFQYTKGKSTLEFSLLKSCLCWLFCLWLSPWRKAFQSGKMHCLIPLITLIQPTCSRDCGCTGDHIGSIRIPFPSISATQKDFKIELWTEALSLTLCEIYIQIEALPPTRVHLLRPLSVIGLMEGGHKFEDPTSFLQGFGRNRMNLVLREPMYFLNYLLGLGLVDPMFLKWGHTQQGWPVMRSSPIGVKKVSSSVAKLILRK